MTTEKPEAIRLADALEQGTFLLSIERDATAAKLRHLHAKVAELEAQLESVGAGGVGPLMAHGHAEQPAAVTLRASDRAVERDELLQVALNFIETLTGMQPPPIEIAPPEVFAPFRDFVDRIQAVTDRRNVSFFKRQPLKIAEINAVIQGISSSTYRRIHHIARAIEHAHGITGGAV